jgi:hypothetical protein
MREYVKFDVDAVMQNQGIPPATPATLAPPQEQSSECSKSSTEVPPFSRSCTPEEIVQGSAAMERGDLHDGDRGRATFAIPATQEGQSSGSSRSSTLSPLDTRSTMTPLCQHVRPVRREGAPQLIPGIPSIAHRPNSPSACYTCGTTRRWRSVYGAAVCGQCHPPADAALVAVWEGAA